MIRVNLLPVKRRKKAKPLPSFVIALVLVLTFTAVGIGWTTYWIQGKIAELNEKIAKDEAHLEELKIIVAEVEDYEKNNADFERKKEVIEKLKRNQNAPTRFLHEIAANLADGVWVSSIKESGWAVTLRGYGFSNTDIVNYMDNLKSSPYINNVELVETKQTKLGDVRLYSFEARFRLKV